MASSYRIRVTLEWVENKRYDAVVTARIYLSPPQKGNYFEMTGIRLAKEKKDKNYNIYFPSGVHRRTTYPVFFTGGYFHRRLLKAVREAIPKKKIVKAIG
jgi:hypothetical protein